MTFFDVEPPLGSKKCHFWSGLQGASACLALAELIQKTEQSLLIITQDSGHCDRIQNELCFFLPPEFTTRIQQFPDWETLPYDRFSPHEDIISERLAALHALLHKKNTIVIASINALIHRIMPVQYLLKHSLILEQGACLDREKQRARLVEAGYRYVDTVYEHGEFSIRGGILDVFPMGAQTAYRIEFMDTKIDSIRSFDTDTQRSINKFSKVKLLPGREFPLTNSAIRQFKLSFMDRFDVDYRNCVFYQDISHGRSFAGAEYYLPLFFEHTATIFDYLPATACIVLVGQMQLPIEHFLQEAAQRYDTYAVDPTYPLLSPREIFLQKEAFFTYLKKFRRVEILPPSNTYKSAKYFNIPAVPSFTAKTDDISILNEVKAYVAKTKVRLLFSVETSGRRVVLLEMLSQLKIDPIPICHWSQMFLDSIPIGIVVSNLEQGMFLARQGLLLLTENELFGKRVMQRRRRKKQEDALTTIRNLGELEINDPVIHLDHGIGRYLGLTTLQIDGQNSEFLTLIYAEKAKLYVPVSNLHLIHRYSAGSETHAPLHKLGGQQWAKQKQKATEKAKDVAVELLDIYARRKSRVGFSFSKPASDYEQFAHRFPFEETPDQKTVIEQVIQDMVASQPMDRLVCGDVGFGKTEIAMRAAFVAVHNNKQVAVIVPTTLLAQQHYHSFCDRFADWPVRIAVLSRFSSAKETQKFKSQLEQGTLDIIIGTHKLLQPNLNFKDLGFIIIDEEHRFGVVQKERLKALRSEIDILTLTATPIPRTLNMALAKIRDLSIIGTAPAKRLSVKTFVRSRNNLLIKEAIYRELLRGGQVFYLHNEVKTITQATAALTKLMPDARIGVAHGQIRTRELEKVMTDFFHKRFNILVCTTIIETGIDIPSANTIIIDRADKFGLAQLHQLRGRVGRSHHQAYAYLLIPPGKPLTKDAQKRLEAIEKNQHIGAGFTLATNDLEIRGAGELLGADQSGHIQNIGYDLYLDILERAVQHYKGGEVTPGRLDLQGPVEVNLQVPALIPETAIPDIHNRLVFYKRIASAQNAEDLTALQVEFIDRFGLIPEPTQYLFRIAEVRLRCQELGIQKVEVATNVVKITFSLQPKLNPMTIIHLIQREPQTYKLLNQESQVLICHKISKHPEERFQLLEDIIQKFKNDK